jgi:DME family drug/metabolite transporter
LVEPAVAAVPAVAIVGEALTAVGWIGLAVIAGVLVILALEPAKRRATREGTGRAHYRSR